MIRRKMFTYRKLHQMETQADDKDTECDGTIDAQELVSSLTKLSKENPSSFAEHIRN